jgi:arginine/lysine/ornithine decarboxylase
MSGSEGHVGRVASSSAAKRILASLDKASAQNRAATNKRARSALVLPQRVKRQRGIANRVGDSDRSKKFTPFADWEF